MPNAWILIEREHDTPLFVGPYDGEGLAETALDSPLVDSFCEIDAVDCYVTTEHPSLPVETVVIDTANPDHTGETA